MPRNRSMGIYLVRFTGPDGEHIAAHRNIPAATDAEMERVKADVERSMRPATEQYPEGNPDITVIEVRPVKDYNEITRAAAELKERNPDRPLLHEIGLDSPNRALHEPEIMRNLAASQPPKE